MTTQRYNLSAASTADWLPHGTVLAPMPTRQHPDVLHEYRVTVDREDGEHYTVTVRCVSFTEAVRGQETAGSYGISVYHTVDCGCGGVGVIIA